MSAELANASVAAAVLLTGLSSLLALLGALAYRRVGHGRLLWVALAFVLLAAQGAWHIRSALAARDDPEFPVASLLSLAVVVCLYFAVLKR